MIILQDAMPGLKRFLSALDLNAARGSMVTRLVVAFLPQRLRRRIPLPSLKTKNAQLQKARRGLVVVAIWEKAAKPVWTLSAISATVRVPDDARNRRPAQGIGKGGPR